MEPFLQAEFRDLPLLFGGFVQFGLGVIIEAALKNRQDLRRRFARWRTR